MVYVKDLIKLFENIAPSKLSEDWDNTGFLLGDSSQSVKKILLCLDITEKVVDEAIEHKVDLIISHHPFIFQGLKRIVYEDSKGRQIIKLIKNNINVISLHTNADFVKGGLNDYLAESLGLKSIKPLKSYKSEQIYKLSVFVPEEHAEKVRFAMCSNGAGWIGNYSDCTFMTEGIGTFMPLEGTNPYIGNKGKLEKVKEIKIETVVSESSLSAVIDNMLKEHPYEEPAYDIFPLYIKKDVHGYGKEGCYETPISFDNFINIVLKKLDADNIRVIGKNKDVIKKVGVFSGSFDTKLIGILKNIDVLVTGDVKHHTALEIIEKGSCVIDAGHFYTERIFVKWITSIISKKFAEIELIEATEENPFILKL